MAAIQFNQPPVFVIAQALAQTANFTLHIPPDQSTQIISIQLNETAGNAITGGLRIGTTNGGANIVAAQAVAANALLVIKDASILIRIPVTLQTGSIFFQAVTSWNGASLNATMILGPADVSIVAPP